VLQVVHRAQHRLASQTTDYYAAWAGTSREPQASGAQSRLCRASNKSGYDAERHSETASELRFELLPCLIPPSPPPPPE
jgi:hypothetical protein